MRQYDLVFGIGGACCCTQALRNAGLQYASFPWDWLTESDIRMRVDQICDDFADWLPKDALTRLETGDYRAGDADYERIAVRPRRGKTGGKSPGKRSMAGIMPKICVSTLSPRCNTRSIISS